MHNLGSISLDALADQRRRSDSCPLSPGQRRRPRILRVLQSAIPWFASRKHSPPPRALDDLPTLHRATRVRFGAGFPAPSLQRLLEQRT